MLSPALQALLGPPGWVRALSPGATPSLALDFANNRYWNGQVRGAVDAIPGWSYSRTGTETDLATGATQFASNVPAFLPGLGLQSYEARTDTFLNVSAPATQNITLGTGTYVVSVIGSGSATSSAGTATGSGFGAASSGSPNVFTLTGAGTVAITISGSPTYVNVQAGAFVTPMIPAAGTSATRGAASASVTGLGSVLTGPMTVFAEWTQATSFSGTRGVVSLSKASTPASFSAEIYQQNAGDRATYEVYDGGIQQCNIGVTLGAAPGAFKAAFVLATNDFRFCLNGTLGTADTSGTVPALDRLGVFTNRDLTLPLNNTGKRIVLYPAALTNAQLQAMTS